MTYATADNITSFTVLLHYGDNVTNGILGITLLIVIFAVAFISMRNAVYDTRGANAKCFSTSAFITTVFAVMFYLLGIASETTMFVCILATAFGVMANVISGNQ